MKSVDQSDAEGTRGSEAGSSRDVGERGQLDQFLHVEFPKHLARYWILDFVNLVTELSSTPVDPVSMFNELCLIADDDIQVSLDAGTDHPARLRPVVGPKIGTPTEETDAKRRPTDNHRREGS